MYWYFVLFHFLKWSIVMAIYRQWCCQYGLPWQTGLGGDNGTRIVQPLICGPGGTRQREHAQNCDICSIKVHILAWPFNVGSPRPTCAIMAPSDQHLITNLWGGWIISALTQIPANLWIRRKSLGVDGKTGAKTKELHWYFCYSSNNPLITLLCDN